MLIDFGRGAVTFARLPAGARLARRRGKNPSLARTLTNFGSAALAEHRVLYTDPVPQQDRV